MSVASKHDIYAVLLDTTPICGMVASNNNLAPEVDTENADGGVYPTQVSTTGQAPSAGWTTTSLKEALDGVPIAGASIAGLTAGLLMYGHAHASGGGRAGASSHLQYKATEGVIVNRSLTADHQGNARLEQEAVIAWDGSNAPIVKSEGVSLPALATAARFTMGPISIGGVTIAGAKSVNIDFGTQAEAEGSDSDLWPSFASIVQARPTITITGIDLAWFLAAGIPIAGKAATHANTTIYLRKRAASGGYVIDGTAEHIKITAAGLCHITQPMSGSAQQAAECTLRLDTIYDGSNAPLVITTASAIT